MVKHLIINVNKPLSLLKTPKDFTLGKVNAVLSTFPENITIVNENISLDGIVTKITIPLLSGQYRYRLEYAGSDAECYKNDLKPFLIYFEDRQTHEINDNCYIANFHKTTKHSGTDVIWTILKFLKLIGVKQVSLFDGSSVTDSTSTVSLSLIKLLELGRTFYNKFGFVHSFEWNVPRDFGTRENFEKVFKESITASMNIEIKDLIKYYTELTNFLSRKVESKELDKIKYYGITRENTVEETEIYHSKALNILGISYNCLNSLLYLNDKESKTLGDLVKVNVEWKRTDILKDILSFDLMPLSLVYNGKRVLHSKFLKPLMVLVTLSRGYMVLDLSRVKRLK